MSGDLSPNHNVRRQPYRLGFGKYMFRVQLFWVEVTLNETESEALRPLDRSLGSTLPISYPAAVVDHFETHHSTTSFMNWANEWCGKCCSCSSLHAAYSENLTAWLLQFMALLEMQKKAPTPSNAQVPTFRSDCMQPPRWITTECSPICMSRPFYQ